jgi:hypothetical protein
MADRPSPLEEVEAVARAIAEGYYEPLEDFHRGMAGPVITALDSFRASQQEEQDG